MAKNFGKILLGLTAAGAAGAGAYYWLKNRHNEEPEDEFDDTFEEDDFELDDDLGEVPERGYTTLTPSSAKFTTPGLAPNPMAASAVILPTPNSAAPVSAVILIHFFIPFSFSNEPNFSQLLQFS